MYILPTKKAALIYPYDKANKQDEGEIVKSNPKDLFGYGGRIGTYGVPIPVVQTYKEFVECMDRVASFLLKVIPPMQTQL